MSKQTVDERVNLVLADIAANWNNNRMRWVEILKKHFQEFLNLNSTTPQTVEEYLEEWVKQGPNCVVSLAEEGFIRYMRWCAFHGVGYGWMQQIIEVEWNSKVSHGGWGPVYFQKRITALEKQVAELKARLNEA